jgi:hypothetical protein
VRRLERARDEGKVRKAGQSWTVEQWLKHWLENIVAPPTLTENAYEAYEVAVRVHLIPGVGAHRIDRLQPEHLERLYRAMIRSGSKAGRAHQVHRTIRAALGEAQRRGHIVENPAALARAPKVEDAEVEPFTVDEVQRILETAARERGSGGARGGQSPSPSASVRVKPSAFDGPTSISTPARSSSRGTGCARRGGMGARHRAARSKPTTAHRGCRPGTRRHRRNPGPAAAASAFPIRSSSCSESIAPSRRRSGREHASYGRRPDTCS